MSQQEQLLALGHLVRSLRAREDCSIEEAARRAGIGHMTLRRLESGQRVRPQTYARLDKLHGLPAGSFDAAARDRGHLLALTDQLGVGQTARPTEDQSAAPTAEPAERRPAVLDAYRRVGQVVRQARKAKGWTAEYASEQAGVAQKTWARVENGEGVRSASLVSIAELFGLQEDALMIALSREDGYLDLARDLGVTVIREQPAERQPAVLAHAGALVAALASAEHTPAAERVLVALLDWMPELVSSPDSNDHHCPRDTHMKQAE